MDEPSRRDWTAAELRARELAGASEVPPIIRNVLSDQHRLFFARLPAIFVSGPDPSGQPSASILRVAPGFVAALAPRLLRVAAALPQNEAIRPAPGSAFALIGIDFLARRRNRVNGFIAEASSNALTLAVEEAYGNCPKYIMPHALSESAAAQGAWTDLTGLDQAARGLIVGADCFFLATMGVSGADMSHRGGAPGFVQIEGETLRIPDYFGNSYYNSFGNLLENPQCALLFPDFKDGGALLLQGRAEVDFYARSWRFSPDAARRLASAPL